MIDYEQNKQNMYLIIDSGSMLYSATNGNKVLDESGNPIKENNKFVYTDKTLEEVKYHLDNILIQLFLSTQGTHYIGFLDYNSKDSRRKAVDARYKSKRIDKPAPLWLKEAKEHLFLEWGFHKIVDGWEADDYCKLHMEHYKELNPILITVDKDLKYSEGIVRDAKNGTVQINSKFDEYKQLCTQMICGDEDLPGIKGKGRAFCEKLFANAKEEELLKLVFQEFINANGNYNGSLEYFKHFYCLYIRKYLDEFEELGCSIRDWSKVPGSY